MKELLIRSRGDKPALALMKDRRLVEYWETEEDTAFQAGAVHLGRAGRVMKSLKAMFVLLMGGVEGFLPFDEMLAGPMPAPGTPLMVQIKKPSQGGKAAYLTQDIALAGRYAMLLPHGSFAHASRRAGDKKAMKLLARRLCPENMGLVLRANAEKAPQADIKQEIESRLALWQQVQEKSARTAAPALLLEAPSPLERLLRDEQELPDQVLCDEEKAAGNLNLPVRLHPDPFGLYGVEQQLYQALKRRVYLPSGGQLFLDPCEAALVIDVNTGKDSKKAGDLILRTNLEAAAEIARLLRLRRAGGIILIDFIDMESDAQRENVQSTLEEALREDRIVSEVLGFTRLGLLEMTRRKAETALKAQRLDPEEPNMPQEENEANDA